MQLTEKKNNFINTNTSKFNKTNYIKQVAQKKLYILGEKNSWWLPTPSKNLQRIQRRNCLQATIGAAKYCHPSTLITKKISKLEMKLENQIVGDLEIKNILTQKHKNTPTYLKWQLAQETNQGSNWTEIYKPLHTHKGKKYRHKDTERTTNDKQYLLNLPCNSTYKQIQIKHLCLSCGESSNPSSGNLSV